MGRNLSRQEWVECRHSCGAALYEHWQPLSYALEMSAIRVRRAIIPTAILLVLFLFVWGCEPRAFTDLRIVSITRVPASQAPRAYGRPIPTDGADLLKISLSGSQQWLRDVKRLEINTYAIIVRCDHRNARLYTEGPYIGFLRVSPYQEQLWNEPSSTKLVQYDVYAPERSSYTSIADPNARMSTYDLRRERMLVCISIAGGSMAGAYGRSNEVRVLIGHS